MSPTIHHKFKYLRSTVQSAEDRQQKSFLLFAVMLMHDLSIIWADEYEPNESLQIVDSSQKWPFTRSSAKK